MTAIFKLLVYGFILYQVYQLNGWVALGLGIAFLMIELLSAGVLQANKLSARKLQEIDKMVKDIGMAVTMNPILSPQIGIAFLSEPFTEEEKKLIPAVKDGDVNSINEFLHLRCVNKSIDFNTSEFPPELKSDIANNLIREIDGDKGSQNGWDEILDDDK